MLEGIKSKLGFADANPHYDDGYYDEGFDDYSEEYGEYGPDYNEDDFPADDAPGSRYEPYAPVTPRSSCPSTTCARTPRCPRASTAIRCRLAV